MNDWIWQGSLMLPAGMALGVVFYGGLWLTLRSLPASRHPYLLTLSSLLLRTVVVLTGLWLFSGGKAFGIVVGMGGFVLVQMMAAFRVSAATGSGNRRAVP